MNMMLLAGIVTLLAFVGGLVYALISNKKMRAKHGGERWYNEYEPAFFSFICAIFGFIITLIACIPLYYLSLGDYQHEDERDIAALNLGGQVSGRFFLGSGVVGKSTVFYYMYQREDGGVEVRYIPSSNAVVYETDDETPHIEMWERSSWIDPGMGGWGSRSSEVEYRIYVPEDSIVTGYSVDLEDA